MHGKGAVPLPEWKAVASRIRIAMWLSFFIKTTHLYSVYISSDFLKIAFYFLL